MNVETLKQQFEARFRRPPTGVVRAPGRVNLIGEHTDYNDGFVLPIAIERQIVGCLGRRDDGVVRFASLQAAEEATVDLDAPIAPGRPSWANYCKGVAAGLLKRGIELRGADVLFGSDIPLGAGLSSSAALEVCTAMALLVAADDTARLPQGELALLCQQAEHQYAGAPCGIMDQSISVMAQAGRALLLDCRTGATEQIPFDDPELTLLVVDTKVRHGIADGEYGLRRAQCESAARKLHLPALRDADAAMIEALGPSAGLDEKESMRARHVVGEIARTLSAVDALRAGNVRKFGELMYESHASLRDDYEVSCPELDAVVEVARAHPAAVGARMTGGGFGGSVIILVAADRADEVGRSVAAAFERRFDHSCGIFTTKAAQGAGVLE